MTDGMSRRRFLRGAGGAALALPTLPSLLPRTRSGLALEQVFVSRSAWAASFVFLGTVSVYCIAIFNELLPLFLFLPLICSYQPPVDLSFCIVPR